MGGIRHSFRALSKNQHAEKLRKIFKNLIILSQKPRSFLDEILELTNDAVQAQGKSAGGGLLTKQKYIAIVGVKKVNNQTCLAVAAEEGFTKGNVKILDDVAAFKKGSYNEILRSSHCVAVIFGGIPHSHSERIEKEISDKVFFARTQSETHGKLKLTKTNLRKLFQEIRIELEKNILEEK